MNNRPVINLIYISS